jgi:hypothetical protein
VCRGKAALSSGCKSHPATAPASARTLISLREMRYGLVSSNPQIAGGKNIDLLFGERGGAEASGHQP